MYLESDAGERCDDGANGDAGDGCRDDCTFACEAGVDCLLLVACGSGENDADPIEANPSPEPPPRRLTLEVQGFDLRGADEAVRDEEAPAEGEPEGTPAEAGPEGAEVTFGYWRGGSPFEGPASVVFESFDDRVLVGHAHDVSIPGSGLANGQERLLTNFQFRAALPAD
ncbi:MAG: hypothetical protein JRH11_24475 [Deltaproteobacteria bacterium]|nr:hypothetical protein [Deltaproteobacteria bacterium]